MFNIDTRKNHAKVSIFENFNTFLTLKVLKSTF